MAARKTWSSAYWGTGICPGAMEGACFTQLPPFHWKPPPLRVTGARLLHYVFFPPL